MRSLVLLGHGSHTDGGAVMSLYHLAEAIRARGVFEEVIEGFWKEEPSLRQVLKTVMSTDVTVVPMFISEGYITEHVIPRELGLGHHGVLPSEGLSRVLGGRQIRYSQPYGLHPTMSDLVLRRAEEAWHIQHQHTQHTQHSHDQTSAPITSADIADIQTKIQTKIQANIQASTQETSDTTRKTNGETTETTKAATKATDSLKQWALVLLAQQQPRYKTMPHPVEQHAKRLRESGVFAEVAVAFGSEKTGIQWPQLQTEQRIVVPFLGSDTNPKTYDVKPNARLLWAKSVGTHSGLVDVILQIAEQHQLAKGKRGDFHVGASEAWESLLDYLEEHHQIRVGEVLIRSVGGVFELRHMLDEGRSNVDLQTVVSPEGLRDVIRQDNAGRYRPVRTWRDVPTGWRAVLCDHDLRRGVHSLYPAVVEESYLYHHRNLHMTPWATTARRQTGAYAKVQKASEEQLEQTVKRVCSGCLKTPLWMEHPLTQTIFDGVAGAMPCGEACTLLIAQLSGELERRVLKMKRF